MHSLQLSFNLFSLGFSPNGQVLSYATIIYNDIIISKYSESVLRERPVALAGYESNC